MTLVRLADACCLQFFEALTYFIAKAAGNSTLAHSTERALDSTIPESIDCGQDFYATER
jgi:hypothetical protein